MDLQHDHNDEEPRLMTRRQDYREAATPSRSRTAKTETPRSRRSLRQWLTGFAALVVVLVFTGLYAALSLRDDMRRSLPQIDGALHVSGLREQVTINRDAHGVPTITAASLDDLLFAQGFVTAQDRLWQMDALRRHAAGELAAILGASLVAHDELERTLQLRATADRALAQMPADARHDLDTYAAGVNAFIAQNADRLPVEFHLLHYVPAPWSARDTLLVELAMYQDLSTEYPAKLAREALAPHLPAQLLPDLYPVGSWRDHPPGEQVPDLTSPRPEIELAPLDETQSSLHTPHITATELQRTDAALLKRLCEDCVSGSNNWVVSGAHTASGRPMVSNDMHLNLAVPDIWYEAVLRLADGSFSAGGVTLPGAPWVIAGRNAHVAWGFTAQLADTQDVYIEHVRGNEFQRADGRWVPLAHDRERIVVRGGRDVTLDIPMTAHTVAGHDIPTPIISALYPSEKRPLALLWTAYDPANLVTPFHAVDAAGSGTALVSALAALGGPSLNVVYADDAGHIGYHAIGRVPVRGAAVPHATPGLPVDPQLDDNGIPPADEEETPQQSLLKSAPQMQTAAFEITRPRRQRGLALRLKPAPTPAPIEEDDRTEVSAQAGLAAGSSPAAVLIGSPIPSTPIDALDANGVWTEYIPYDAMPSVIDPASGLIVTANSRIAPDTYTYRLANDWLAPYRTERIVHLLNGRTGLTPVDMLAVQMDIHSEFDLALAQRLAYALDHAAPAQDAARLRVVADILRHWDGNVTRDSVAPNIVAATRAALWPMLLTPQIAAHDRIGMKSAAELAALYEWNGQTTALEQIVAHEPARWLPAEEHDWNSFLAHAVQAGLALASAPSDLSRWTWSSTHVVELDHPVLSMSPLFHTLLGAATGTGPWRTGGDGTTVKQTSTHFGPSQRFTADMGGTTTMNITTGQSGNPRSAWYLDQFPMWLGGTTLPMESAAAHRLRLLP